MAHFKDKFSRQSDVYLKYRPFYPDELFEYLQSLTESHDLALDCGTGNGQAAIGLTKYYKKVIAMDPSEEQIKNGLSHPRITYKKGIAEQSGLESSSVDLITVAQALHWFQFDRFYAEANRILKKNGVIAIWTYGLPAISDEIDRIVKYFHDEVLDDYWLYENRLVENEYTTIHFPFPQMETPVFEIIRELSLEELTGLLSSWSAVEYCKQKTGTDPVKVIHKDLKEVWGDPDHRKKATWKIRLIAGRLNTE